MIDSLEITSLLKKPGVKVLHTSTPWDLLRIITSEVKQVQLITPLTKISDLYKWNHTNVLVSLLQSLGDDYQLVNRTDLNSMLQAISKQLGEDVLVRTDINEKLFKALFELDNRLLTKNDLRHYLHLLMNTEKQPQTVVLVGWEQDLTYLLGDNFLNSLPLNFVTSNFLKIGLTISQLALVYFVKDEIFHLEDKDVLRSWLEQETKLVLSNQILENFLQGKLKDDLLSFKIDQLLKELVIFK